MEAAVRKWLGCLVVLLGIALANPPRAQTPQGKNAGQANDLELVEKLLLTRRDYQKALENLRVHYWKVGDPERAKWAEEELRQYQRIPKQAFRLDLDVPPPNLVGNTNIPEANKIFTAAMAYKEKGWGTDYIDNQRRAEILFQKLLTEYPQSNRIDEAAYQLGDIYDSKAYKQYRRAGAYFERCFQWNPKTTTDARLRAAHIYDKQLSDRSRAIEIYKEITTHETDAKRLAEAQKRLTELSGTR
jgi:tetratricopeptide (TPR) repeat protein